MLQKTQPKVARDLGLKAEEINPFNSCKAKLSRDSKAISIWYRVFGDLPYIILQ